MADLVFTRVPTDHPGSLALHVSDLPSRSGIYWLAFDDGSEYVGQSIEVVRRLADHRRHQRGVITSVAFAPVAATDLDAAERWFIEWRDGEGATLRNVLITRRPGGPGPGTVVVRPGISVNLPWERDRRTRVGATPSAGPASDLQADQWKELIAHLSWSDIRQFLRRFLRESVSAPDLTAGRLWTVSAMPRTTPLPGWRRLCTLNVGRIEALYIGQHRAAGTLVQWNLAVPEQAEEEHLVAALTRLDSKGTASAEVHDHYSESTLTLTGLDVSTADALLDVPVVADLSYRFVTRYQRQGMALQRRHHNSLFAQDLLAAE